MKEPGHHDTIELPSDYHRILYRQHFQGALVRSTASVAMWLFALVAFLTNDIDSHSFKGVSLSVIYLISINPPALWLLKVISRRIRVYKYFTILINLLEIFGYTTIIYFLGGIESAYLTLIYAALITYIGIIAPRRLPFVIAVLCSVMFSLIVIGEHFDVIPHQRIVSYPGIPWLSQQLRLAVVIGLLFLVAYISSYTANILKKNRNRLHRQNLELMEKTAILEETKKKLHSNQQSLEIRVRERSVELAKANKDLQAELTDRKRAEESLRLITDNMSDMVRVTDLQGVNLYTSPSHAKVLGYKPEERAGKSGFEIVHPDDLEHLIKVFSEGLINKKPGKVEYRIKHAEGHYVWLETMADGIMDDQGEVTAVIQSSRDITERKRVEEENRTLAERLQRAEKMEALGQLAGGVAHDLNNVLGVLSGYSQLLLLEIPEGSPVRGHAETILQSTEKGAAIIQDLLTLARRGVTVSDVINLNDVVSGFLQSPVFEKMKDHYPRVTFRTECDQNLLNIKGSPVHLEKTLMNLVSNAAESISGKGEVTIRTESRYLDKAIGGYDEVKEGDYTVLTVSDTGMGIPAENKDKIFEPFYTKKKMGRSGTGLGLAIVWGTVKDHNGYIDLQTEVEQGSAFALYFPVTREELIAPQQNVPIERYMGNGESVLVVDDIAEQRGVASRLLTRLGYKVHAVSSGQEAVEYLQGNKADILVLDMIMAPGIDGLETYERVLEINPQQRAILVSGFSETERVKEAQKLGAGAYVKKPYVMEKIGVAIRDELLKVTISIH